ncbi:MAG: quinolinate synthase NadA, partial [Bacillota bacterium]
MGTIIKQIEELKKEKEAAILAHYYTDEQIQALADYVGDSYYLSKIATEIPQKTILFCGVTFMGESAKILNPEKTIIMPDNYADCPMAQMADIDEIKAVREK